MLQDRINISYTAAELTSLDTALTTLEGLLARIPNLDLDEQSHVSKMPDGAWGFILTMRTLAQQHLDKLPREYTDTIIATDVDTRNAVAERLLRLVAIHDRLDLGLMLAESDCWASGRYIRSHLTDGGLGASIEAQLDDGMRRFFNRPSPPPTPPANPPAPNP